MRLGKLLSFALTSALLAGCSDLLGTEVATPIPTEQLPTAIAMTLEAIGVQVISPVPPTAASTALTPTVALSAAIKSSTSLPTLLPATWTATPLPPGAELTATLTPLPAIPEARIQIYRLGELSLVTSPIEVTTRLTSRVGKVVRIELYGEDGRLLARHVRTYERIPWNAAMIGVDLEFEISAAAEAGRLVISVEDTYGRLIDVNSVSLILLSQGITELNPASALQQAIVIQDPLPDTLIQGGKLYVSGLAKPTFPDKPLKVALIAQDGRLLGQRLAGITFTTPGFHGTFFAEVPYSVGEMTPALLVVFEDGGAVSLYTHLASLEVVLGP